eukprot:3940690-Rhodomonas_salina.2
MVLIRTYAMPVPDFNCMRVVSARAPCQCPCKCAMSVPDTASHAPAPTSTAPLPPYAFVRTGHRIATPYFNSIRALCQYRTRHSNPRPRTGLLGSSFLRPDSRIACVRTAHRIASPEHGSPYATLSRFKEGSENTSLRVLMFQKGHETPA